MTYYNTFGLTLSSPVELSVPTCPEGTPDIRVEFSRTSPPPSEHPWDITGTPDSITFFWAEAGWFTISSGQRITISPIDSCGIGVLEDSILGEALGVAIIQRQALLLHASAIETSNGAVVFCGDSGLGKSTMAYLTQQHGGLILCDDLCLITMINGWPHVVPGPPFLKVREPALRGAGKDPADFERAFEGSKKYRVTSGTATAPVPLNHLLFIERGDTLRCTPCPTVNLFLALMENSFASHLSHSYEFEFLDASMKKNLFKACEDLAHVAPCSILTRTDTLPSPTDLQAAGVFK